ncbi:MAG: YafY family transcriptional regulator [Solobacterium sp.]|nr:YafY family transcriptional regulator [Solobacterium sp.]
MRTDRLIAILSVLLQRKSVTAPQLAEMFEVSRRTIARDIEALNMAGIPIVTKPGVNGGVSLLEGYRLDHTVFTKKEMQDLLAGLRSLDSVEGSNRYTQLMNKLSAGASVRRDDTVLINLAAWNKTAVSRKIERIRKAIEEGLTLQFAYDSQSGHTSRKIEPYYLIFEWSRWYVYGYDIQKEDFRLFKLNRMTDVMTGEAFVKKTVVPPDLSNETVFPASIHVMARIEKAYAWRILEDFGPDSFHEEDGKLLFEFDFSDEAYILSWALSFQTGLELLAPQNLRRKLKEMGDYLQKTYWEP